MGGDAPAAAFLGVGALEAGGGDWPVGVPDLPGAGGPLQVRCLRRLHRPGHAALRLLVLQDGPVKDIVPLVPCAAASPTPAQTSCKGCSLGQVPTLVPAMASDSHHRRMLLRIPALGTLRFCNT